MRVGADGVAAAAAAANKSVVAWLGRVGPVSAWVLFSCAVQQQHSCACQACPLARLTAAGHLGLLFNESHSGGCALHTAVRRPEPAREAMLHCCMM